MRALRFLVATILGVAVVPLASGAANAAPPTNDEAGGAVVLTLGQTVTQDTTQATTNAGDDALNANCGAPFTNASVWYQYTPSINRKLVIDATASDYSAGVMIFQGTPSPDSLVACGPGAVGLSAQGGNTYFIMVFSDTEVNGGNMVLSLKTAPTPRAHVTVDKLGKAFHGGGGAARIHGTYSCRHDDSFAGLSVHLTQRAGRLKVQADSGAGVICDGRTHRWSAKMSSPFGTYAAGRARARARLDVCGFVTCRHDRTKRRIHLVWASSSAHALMVHPSAFRAGRPHAATSRTWPSH